MGASIISAIEPRGPAYFSLARRVAHFASLRMAHALATLVCALSDSGSRLVLAPSDAGGSVDVHAPIRSAAFAVSAGTIDETTSSRAGVHARWRLAPTIRPDFHIIAAFDDERLVGFAALPRSARIVLEVEDAKHGATVTARILGREFRVVADGSPVTLIPVDVPPGASTAEVTIGRKVVPVNLVPPPHRAEHELVSPDGSRWLFRIAADGSPSDGPVPDGATWMAAGAYRWPRAPSPSPTADVVSAGAAAGSDRSIEPAAPSVIDSPLHARSDRAVGTSRESVTTRAPYRWRAGLGASAGPTFEPGAALTLARQWSPGAWWNVAATTAILFGQSRHAVLGSALDTQRRTLGTAAFAEFSAPVVDGPVGAALGVGAGVASSWRHVTSQGRRSLDRFVPGPFASASFRAARKSFAFELRAVWSPALLGVEESPWLAMGAATWAWGP